MKWQVHQSYDGCGAWCCLMGRGYVVKKRGRREIGEAGPNTALILIKLTYIRLKSGITHIGHRMLGWCMCVLTIAFSGKW